MQSRRQIIPKSSHDMPQCASCDCRQSEASPNMQGDRPQIVVSNFDYSVENHFKALDDIDTLCGSCTLTDADEKEIERLSNSITFLTEWQDFVYEPRAVKFSFLNDSVKLNVGGEISLSQFSSASVPKREIDTKSTIFEGFSRDFVMNVGGSVWGLDWCPKLNHDSGYPVNSEFVAIAAHPPNSSYHKIGAPLTGRGAIQIWCFLSAYHKEDFSSDRCKKSTKRNGACQPSGQIKPSRPRGRPRKYPRDDTMDKIVADNHCPKPVPKSRGRARKYPRKDAVDRMDDDNQYPEPLAIEYPPGSSRSNISDSADEHVTDENSIRIHKDSVQLEQTKFSALTASDGIMKLKTWKKAVDKSSSFLRSCEQKDSLQDPPSICPVFDIMSPAHAKTCEKYNDTNTVGKPIISNFELPRMMLCLAHDGRVAWDLKWQPLNACNPVSTNSLGFLAVLLGNGALEVWEVPHPRALKIVYPANQERTDPRFVKLCPVFRCSILKCGDRQSIPLTMEWSSASPYDMILAGCHDGLIALWKFSITGSAVETRPLLSFIADAGPIRTLAWAPVQSDLESANIIVTAGHRGFKFWDIRDPFRPLWDHALQGITYSLDWLPEPRCVFGSVDDGTMWFVNLENIPRNLPVAKSQCGSSKHGIHSFDCSSFSIWSIQASKLTGAIAYCGEEGTANCFQPTSRSVKDPSRNRIQHVICGSFSIEESTIVVSTPSSPTSAMKKTSTMKRSKEGNNTTEGDKIESFPGEIVCVHRLRWSPNKSSEKWLCYGGSAGLVRCQQVDFSLFNL